MNTYEIDAWDDGGVRVVRVTGEFDLSACEEFKAELRPADYELTVIDLRRTSFIDSHGLSRLIEAHNDARASATSVAIIRPEGYADRIFKITGMDAHLPLYDERVPILAQMNYG